MIVLVSASIDLLVNTSVVALPTKVSVASGKVVGSGSTGTTSTKPAAVSKPFQLTQVRRPSLVR